MVGDCSVDVKGAGWLLQLRRQRTATHLSRLDAVEEVAQQPPRGVSYSVVHRTWRAWRDRFALALLLRRFAIGIGMVAAEQALGSRWPRRWLWHLGVFLPAVGCVAWFRPTLILG